MHTVCLETLPQHWVSEHNRPLSKELILNGMLLHFVTCILELVIVWNFISASCVRDLVKMYGNLNAEKNYSQILTYHVIKPGMHQFHLTTSQ